MDINKLKERYGDWSQFFLDKAIKRINVKLFGKIPNIISNKKTFNNYLKQPQFTSTLRDIFYVANEKKYRSGKAYLIVNANGNEDVSFSVADNGRHIIIDNELNSVVVYFKSIVGEYVFIKQETHFLDSSRQYKYSKLTTLNAEYLNVKEGESKEVKFPLNKDKKTTSRKTKTSINNAIELLNSLTNNSWNMPFVVAYQEKEIPIIILQTFPTINTNGEPFINAKNNVMFKSTELAFLRFMWEVELNHSRVFKNKGSGSKTLTSTEERQLIEDGIIVEVDNAAIYKIFEGEGGGSSAIPFIAQPNQGEFLRVFKELENMISEAYGIPQNVNDVKKANLTEFELKQQSNSYTDFINYQKSEWEQHLKKLGKWIITYSTKTNIRKIEKKDLQIYASLSLETIRNESAITDDITKQLSAGLISKIQALMIKHNLTRSEADEYLKQGQADTEKDKSKKEPIQDISLEDPNKVDPTLEDPTINNKELTKKGKDNAI